MAAEPQATASKAAPARQRLREAARESFIAEDPVSTALLLEIERIAASSANVLIEGESGSGKDLAASLLHYLGAHPEEPLVSIDCAALPRELMESELFGYERGAFTGAAQTKRGRFELAQKGTLLLDDIGALSLSMQAKLLRVLEDRSFFRLGGEKSIKFSARIIATTSEPLGPLVSRGLFREDLFYRLNVVPIAVPPLRSRPADVVPIARRMLAQAAERMGGAALNVHLTSSALQALQAYTFPGNIRELRNLLERALVRATGPVITAEDLPHFVRSAAAAGAEAAPSLEEIERRHIAHVLDLVRGRKGKAAAILGISRKTLLEKRRKYGLL